MRTRRGDVTRLVPRALLRMRPSEERLKITKMLSSKDVAIGSRTSMETIEGLNDGSSAVKVEIALGTKF